MTSYGGETDAGEEGCSVMLENIPPPHLDTTTTSSDVTGRSEDEEPTTVVTTGDLLEVAGAATPGPVETATRGGETTFFFGRGTQSAEKKKHFHDVQKI